MEPFTEDRDSSIARYGEKGLLHEIRKWLGDVAPPTPFGMGDDCAVLPAGDQPARLLTTDSVILGRHFEAITPPAQAGAKLLKRNLSDIAAMGGTPAEAVLAGLLPRNVRIDWLEQFVRGLAETARAYGVRIVGGDLAETSMDLAFNLTLIGAGGQLLYRHGGEVGDWICVTGQLGGSRLGRHLSFTPRLREGQLLAAAGCTHACIDISDGLAIDLCALLGQQQQASLDPAAIPLHPDAGRLAAASGQPPLWHALNDGEDHELLFLLAPLSEEKWDALRRRFADGGLAPITRIGTVITGAPAQLVDAATGKPVAETAGYDHFR